MAKRKQGRKSPTKSSLWGFGESFWNYYTSSNDAPGLILLHCQLGMRRTGQKQPHPTPLKMHCKSHSRLKELPSCYVPVPLHLNNNKNSRQHYIYEKKGLWNVCNILVRKWNVIVFLPCQFEKKVTISYHRHFDRNRIYFKNYLLRFIWEFGVESFIPCRMSLIFSNIEASSTCKMHWAQSFNSLTNPKPAANPSPTRLKYSRQAEKRGSCNAEGVCVE